jgi:hypothetical protein
LQRMTLVEVDKQGDPDKPNDQRNYPPFHTFAIGHRGYQQIASQQRQWDEHSPG